MTRTNTSASNFHRRVSCLASARVEKELPEPPDSPDSKRGTELHRLWANPTLPREHLSDDDLSALEAVENITNEMVERVGGENRVDTASEMKVSLFAGTPYKIWSTADCVIISEPVGSVIGIVDAKFGRIEVDEAADNWQLAVYAVSLAAAFSEVQEVIAIIAQPWAKKSAPVRYTRAELESLQDQILDVLKAGEAPNAAYNPTPSNCRYCKGALLQTCPARHEFALAPVKSSAEIAIRDPETFLLSLAADKRTQLLDALAMAVDMNDAIRKAARSMLKSDPAAIPGYSVKPDTETRKIVDITAVWQALSIKGITHSELLAAVSMPITNTTKLYKKATGLKGKELDDAFERFLDPLCDKVPRAGNLERE